MPRRNQVYSRWLFDNWRRRSLDCLILGKNKLGLMTTYIFVAYWGILLNKDRFINQFGEATMGLYLYVFLAVLLASVAILGFMREKE